MVAELVSADGVVLAAVVAVSGGASVMVIGRRGAVGMLSR